jgi:hypothetical protein
MEQCDAEISQRLFDFDQIKGLKSTSRGQTKNAVATVSRIPLSSYPVIKLSAPDDMNRIFLVS